MSTNATALEFLILVIALIYTFKQLISNSFSQRLLYKLLRVFTNCYHVA